MVVIIFNKSVFGFKVNFSNFAEFTKDLVNFLAADLMSDSSNVNLWVSVR